MTGVTFSGGDAMTASCRIRETESMTGIKLGPVPHLETDLGLTSMEISARIDAGLVNDLSTSTRTVREILKANILRPFNALLGGLLQ